jgi:hypothetical protein
MKHALTLSVALMALPALSAPTSKDVHKTLALPADGRVDVSTYKGSVTVTPWDRAEVDVEARVEADDGCGNETTKQRWVDQTEVRIEGSSRAVNIESDYHRLEAFHEGWGFFGFGSCTSRPFVHYKLQIPRTAKLYIKDYKSTLKVGPMHTDMEIDTYKGTVDVSGLDGSLDLKTYKGEVRVAYDRFAGSSRFETYKGDIEIAVPKNAGFDLHADTDRRGDFRSDFDVATRVQARSRTRDSRIVGTVNGGGSELVLKTTRGSFSLKAR